MTLSPSQLLAIAQSWCEEDPDPVTKAELAAIIAKAQQHEQASLADLADRFGSMLEFGTAGLRGLLGAGTNRMNRLLVLRVSAGLAQYLLAHDPSSKHRGVVVGYDGRRNSTVFARDTACVLAGFGFRVMLAHRPWPTPTTAWAVVRKQACAGVMVTASHNPPEYNGYKVYWANGAQIIPPHDVGIAAAIAKVTTIRGLNVPSFADLRGESRRYSGLGAVEVLDESLHEEYLGQVNKLRSSAAAHRDLVIAYTAMHGVGAVSVESALARAGFANVHGEPSQRNPDGEFPTVRFPNPEEKGAMDRALALATKVHADVVLANDPDADRLCVAVPVAATGSEQRYQLLTGDQVGCLLADYLLAIGVGSNGAKAARRLVASTVVSSQMLSFLAREYGVSYAETLTGFKWIANAALGFEANEQGEFVMGYEEALGYSVGPLVRDKDGVSAAVVFAELVAWNRAQGRSVLAHLEELYRRVGLFVTEQVSLTMPGAEGMALMAGKMAKLRSTPPNAIGDYAVEQVVDLERGGDGLPPSNVLVFRLSGGNRVIVRPSGTEPKLKSYYEVRVAIADGESVAAANERGKALLAALRDSHQAMLK